jgi:hypothetical protein
MHSQFAIDPGILFWRWQVLSGPGKGRWGWALSKEQAKRAATKAAKRA